MVVLGVLALFNIGLVYFLYRDLQKHEQRLMEELLGIESYLVDHDTETIKQIKKIPKEITVKNVLKLP